MNLEDYIYKECLTYGDYTLSSGKKSDKYFDLRKLTMHKHADRWLGYAFTDLILNNDIHLSTCGSVGGMETGAIPLAMMLARQWYFDAFYVRKNPKGHGLRNRVEGCWSAPYIVVDDVVTTGTSIRKVEEAIETCLPAARLCIIDRRTENKNPEILSLFKESDFT